MAHTKSIQRFGEKLRELRQRHQLTLVTLADELGYTGHGYLSELESGKKLPSLDLLLKVSLFFNVSTDCLLKDDLELD